MNPGEVCGSGAGAGAVPLITFRSHDHPSRSRCPSPPDDPGTERTTTWWLDDARPARVVRRTCAGTAAAVVDPHYPVVARLADRGEETAGVATSAASARSQVAAECSSDGVSFHACAAGDTGTHHPAHGASDGHRHRPRSVGTEHAAVQDLRVPRRGDVGGPVTARSPFRSPARASCSCSCSSWCSACSCRCSASSARRATSRRTWSRANASTSSRPRLGAGRDRLGAQRRTPPAATVSPAPTSTPGSRATTATAARSP